MSLENLKQAIPEGRAYEPIQKEDLAFEDEKLDDLSAMKLVVQSAEIAEKFILSKTLVPEWNACDELYRAYVPVDKWPNSEKLRSHLPMPVVMEAIESLLPQAHMALFSEQQPFLLDPKGKTSPEAARAMAHVVCWAMEETGFEEEIRKILKSSFQYGMGIGKWGWLTCSHTEKTYKRGQDGSVESENEEHEVSRPTFEYVDIRTLLVDPLTNCHDIRTARWVIFQKFVTADELDELREDYENVPTREELAMSLVSNDEPTRDTLKGAKWYTWRENQAAFPTDIVTPNPLKQPLELLEYWDGERVITLFQRKIVLRNEEHEYEGHCFLSSAFIDVLNSFYGFGVAKLLAGEQSLQAGVINKSVDWLSLKLNPVWHRKKGLGTMSQNVQVSPGRVINDDGDLEPLNMGQDITEIALNAIAASESRAARRVGANFGPDMPTQAMRTAEGVQAFTSGVQVRLQYFIEDFAKLVFIPAIRQFIELCKDNLTPEQINAILSERDGKEFQGDVLDVYNGQYSVDVLSSVKIAGRRAMAQLLIPVMQMLGQPAVTQSFNVQGKKFDWVEFFEEVFDVAGWPGDNLIVDMSPEDQQRMMMMNPAVVKAQSDQQQQAQDFQNQQSLLDQKGDVQAGVAVVKSTLKAHEPQSPTMMQQ